MQSQSFAARLVCATIAVLLSGVFVSVAAVALPEHGADETVASTEQANTAGNETLTPARLFGEFLRDTGLRSFFTTSSDVPYQDTTITVSGWKSAFMIGVGLILIYLAIAKQFEPLLLLPIGFATLLVNVPLTGIAASEGFLNVIYQAGIANGLFPILIFMGVGALTDFGPLIANPKTALLGAAAQFGIFGSLFGAVALNMVPGISFTIREACAISIIGGADGPTSIYVARELAEPLLGPIAVAAYSYMAMVPLIQPPLMKLFTTPEQRRIRMKQLRPVGRIEKILFPLLVLLLTALLLPSAIPLIGALTFGNLTRECGVVQRLSKTMQNELINIVTIFLGLGVGMQMSAHRIMQLESAGIIVIGLVAFSVGTVAGVLFGRLMNRLSKDPINPLIGGAGVSAVPMAARVANKVGMDADGGNVLIMHAMGPNVAGVIGSAIAAGFFISVFG